MNDEVKACASQLEALSIERRRLEVVGLRDTPEYDEIAAEWDRARIAHYEARTRADDDPDTFKAEMEYVGFTPISEEDYPGFLIEREEAEKNMQAVLSGNFDGEYPPAVIRSSAQRRDIHAHGFSSPALHLNTVRSVLLNWLIPIFIAGCP